MMLDLIRPTCLDILAVLSGVVLMDVLVLAFVRAGNIRIFGIFKTLVFMDFGGNCIGVLICNSV